MASFLRDELIANLTISADSIVQISDVLLAMARTMPEFLEPDPDGNPKQDILLYYTIRFDEKGIAYSILIAF